MPKEIHMCQANDVAEFLTADFVYRDVKFQIYSPSDNPEGWRVRCSEIAFNARHSFQTVKEAMNFAHAGIDQHFKK
jgi:hypothetical protein